MGNHCCMRLIGKPLLYENGRETIIVSDWMGNHYCTRLDGKPLLYEMGIRIEKRCLPRM